MPKNIIHIYVEAFQLDPIQKNFTYKGCFSTKIYNGDSISVQS
jgi:hypothetical protein